MRISIRAPEVPQPHSGVVRSWQAGRRETGGMGHWRWGGRTAYQHARIRIEGDNVNFRHMPRDPAYRVPGRDVPEEDGPVSTG